MIGGMTKNKNVLNTHHARQCSANSSKSLEATPDGVVERFRTEGGGTGLAFLPVLGRPEKVGEEGELPVIDWLEVTDLAEGRS